MKVFMLAGVSGLFFIGGNAMAEGKTCQSAEEIRAHVYTNAPEEFCFHKVVDPTLGLVSGKAIPRFIRLMPNFKVAFLNTYTDFDGAQRSCAGLGSGWHAPVSSDQYADPRAVDTSKTLEAVAEYFNGLLNRRVWASSTFSNNTDVAWDALLADGKTYGRFKNEDGTVVCVRP